MAEDQTPRRVTLKDVAREADVSVASASYAINGTGSLGSAVRAHILGVAARLGYRQNMSARAMRTGKTGAIGLVVPDFTNPFFTSLAQSVMRSARLAGYCVFVTDTEESEDLEREAFKHMINRGVDGVVWFPIRDINTVEPQTKIVPTLLLDRSIEGLESILADYDSGGKLAARHLLALGHTKIGIVAGPLDIVSQRQRIEGAVATLGESVSFQVSNGFSMDLEPLVQRTVLESGVTAIFAGTDLIAMGVIRCLQNKGLRVPEDVSVVGFGDMPWAPLSNPSLTTVEMPIEDMAATAVETLICRIENRPPLRPRGVFSTRLIVRGSTAQLRQQRVS